MGNNSTKESRSSDHSSRSPTHAYAEASSIPSPFGVDRPISRARNRASRPDITLFGLGAVGSSNIGTDQPFERRETKAEREARRLERERVARAKERERSMREEHVDGGFLVTLGTYTGPEDFSKPVVRQLQVGVPGRMAAASLERPRTDVSLDRSRER